jgi:hypothetical protein
MIQTELLWSCLRITSNDMISTALTTRDKLAPQDSQQLVQHGGSILLRGDEILYSHEDSGVLMITDVEALMAVVQAATSHAPRSAQLR